MAFLKSWFSHTFCIVVGIPCPPQYKMYGKTMIHFPTDDIPVPTLITATRSSHERNFWCHMQEHM